MTLLMIATTVAKLNNCERPSAGTPMFSNTPRPSSWPESRNRFAS
jgi:hypothetical protein